MNTLTIALATVIWSTLPVKSHLDYRQYNQKLHRGAKMEYRHIPVTRVSDNHYFESNRKLHKTSTDFKVRLTEANIPAKDWKGNNRKFHKK